MLAYEWSITVCVAADNGGEAGRELGGANGVRGRQLRLRDRLGIQDQRLHQNRGMRKKT